MFSLFFFACTNSQPQGEYINTKDPSPSISPSVSPSLSNFHSDVKIIPKSIPNADGYFAADLNNDGVDEEIYFDKTGLRFQGDLINLEGHVQKAVRGDHNKDGKEELIIAIGAGKGFRKAKMQIISFSDSGMKTLWSEQLGNNQIPDMHFTPNGIFFVHSDQNQEFTGSMLINGTRTALASSKLALRMLPKDTKSVYVGRVYGDEPRSDGDLRLFTNGTETLKLQTFRGIRALALSDVDQNMKKELLVSDGWHYQYGTMARARVSLYVDDASPPILIADLPREYTINRIEEHRFEKNIFLLEASRGAYILFRTKYGWQNKRICKYSEGNNAVFSYDKDTTNVLCSGTRSQKSTLSFVRNP